ncbi:MAG: S8 family serine peptidase, partial [Oscillospiraceae bacterium]|nr:S8 family serine peptidase [Oscillospiraceae bacterium]
MKRVISILISFCMLITPLPASLAANAEDDRNDSVNDSESGGIREETIDASQGDNVQIDNGQINNDTADFWEVVADVEEYYVNGSTIYDLENEQGMEYVPDELQDEIDDSKSEEFIEEPIEEGLGDEDSEIYDDYLYEDEINAQLAGDEYALDEIIIKFKEPWQVPGKEKQLQQEIDKVKKVGFVEGLGVYVVKIEELDKNPNAILNRFKNNKYIEYVEPNYILKPDLVPKDPDYYMQYALLTIINAQTGWDIITGGSGPIVAVVDTGVANHPDLPPLLPGYSAEASLSPNNDKVAHGTGVAGTIGAIGNNNLGGAGLNWNASIMPVKVDDANGVLYVANISKGIIWATDNGAKIINLSLGSTADSTTLKNAIDYAYNRGVAIFAATGNENRNSISFPARYSNVMAIGGSANGTARVNYSNYGPGISAVSIGGYYTTTAKGGYEALSGTSFSTPQAAGLASLILAINPKLTNDQVYRMIEQNCKLIGSGFNEETGYGLLDVGKTLAAARASVGGSQAPIATSMPTPAPASTPTP